MLTLLARNSRLRQRIVTEGGVTLIEIAGTAAYRGSQTLREWYSALICNLTFTPSCRGVLVSNGICGALSVMSDTKNKLALRRCAMILCNISCDSLHVPKMVTEGACVVNVQLCSSHDEDTRLCCAKALCNLSRDASAQIATSIIASGAVKELLIVAIVRSESGMTKLACLTAIANLIHSAHVHDAPTRPQTVSSSASSKAYGSEDEEGEEAEDKTIMGALIREGVVWAMTTATKLGNGGGKFGGLDSRPPSAASVRSIGSESDDIDDKLEEGLAILAATYMQIVEHSAGRASIIAERGAIRSVATLLSSAAPQTQKYGWEIMRKVCSEHCQQRLVEEGALQVMRHMKDGGETLASNTAALLAFLTRDASVQKRIARDVMLLLRHVCGTGDAQTSVYAAEVICRVATDETLCTELIRKEGLRFTRLLAMCDDVRVHYLCTLSLFHFASVHENLKRLVDDDIVDIIRRLLPTANSAALEMLMACIRSVSWEPSSHQSLVDAGVVAVIGSILQRARAEDAVTEAMNRDCAEALCCLSYHLGDYRQMLDEGIMSILISLADPDDELTVDHTEAIVVVSLSHLASEKSIGMEMIDSGIVPTLINLLKCSKGLDAYELRQDILAALCSLSFCTQRGSHLVEEGVYDIVSRLSKQNDRFIRKCCGTILSNLSAFATNTKPGSVEALLDLCLPKEAGAELKRRQSGLVLSQDEIDSLNKPKGSWFKSKSIFLQTCKCERSMPDPPAIVFRADTDKSEQQSNRTNPSSGIWEPRGAGTAGNEPPMPDLPNLGPVIVQDHFNGPSATAPLLLLT